MRAGRLPVAAEYDECDVAVIGLGPTGATLANLLGDLGLSVLVLEREDGIYDLPRAVHFDDEVMRVLQWVGIADAYAEQVFVNKGMRFVDAEDNLLLDWPRPPEISENGWHASYRFHQPDLEGALRQALSARPCVAVRLGCNVETVRDDGCRVHIRYRDVRTGEVAQSRCRYLVGCDGANSVVRRAMNSEMESLGFAQRWLVVDVILRRDMTALGDHTVQYCDPVRSATYCRNVGRRRRWEFALLEDEDNASMSREDAVWAMLGRWVTPEDAILERRAVYTFKSEIANSWRSGRMMLAGDAAHLTPPFMGQGMCAGIRDAANLAWKLDRCCRGQGGDVLLDTYQSERRENVAGYIRTAMKLGSLIGLAGSKGPSALGLATDRGVFDTGSMIPVLGPGLGRMDDGLRGRLFPQVTLASGRRLDDEVGYAPFLVVRGEMRNQSCWGGIQVLNTEDEPGLAAVLDSFRVRAVLVRPDKRILAGSPDLHALGDIRMMAQQAFLA